MTDTSFWYAVHTQPREEMKALTHLMRQGYQAYLPRYARKIRHARKTEHALRALFPRYLFVKLDLAIQGWRPIRSTMGVVDIVCFGEKPTPLPDGVIESLKGQEDGDGFIQFVNQPTFKPGDPIMILTGPFSHQLGLCEGVTDKQRIAILLELLGRKVRVTLDAEAVEAA